MIALPVPDTGLNTDRGQRGRVAEALRVLAGHCDVGHRHPLLDGAADGGRLIRQADQRFKALHLVCDSDARSCIHCPIAPKFAIPASTANPAMHPRKLLPHAGISISRIPRSVDR